MRGHRRNKVRSGGAAGNNNAGIVRKLAMGSIRTNKLRNFFVIITIALSVSLLTVVSLFYAGVKRSKSGRQPGCSMLFMKTWTMPCCRSLQIVTRRNM